MAFLEKFLRNHVLANLAFVLVLIVGAISYSQMPRQQDPTINFNWIQIFTYLPGASAADVEKRITDPLEDAVDRVANIKFVNSSSREGVSSMLIRFDDINERTFDKRVNDLRREIQNKEAELPEDATTPYVIEITSSNGFPTASIVIYGEDSGENLHNRARTIEKDIERIKGVDSVTPVGWRKSELQVRFKPDHLVALGVNPTDLMDTIRANFRDVSAGAYEVGQQTWLVRVLGAKNNPEYLAQMPVITNRGEIALGSIADVSLTREKAEQLISYQGKPAILLTVAKQANTNTLSLLERVNDYIASRNEVSQNTGVALYLVDDQTQVTRDALSVMQNNALLGLFLVLIVTWLFLGIRIALLTSIGIPFILAGTFILLKSFGETLNVSVLLGVVISLGMLVDDAVVVVESIYYRLQRGKSALESTMEALKEVFAPVTTAVLTTMAAFMPLMLIPGILGKFMKVIPMVVCTALAVSLIEAYWMLPAHIMGMKPNFKRTKMQIKREALMHNIRLQYTRWLIKVLRYPLRALSVTVLILSIAIGGFASGAIKVDFFASDPLRIFYVNIKMPQGTTLKQTQDMVLKLEQKALSYIKDGELRASVGISGQMFTEVSAAFGDRYGQVMMSLNPVRGNMREVDDIIDTMRTEIKSMPGAENIYFFRLAGGPPTTKPVDIKVTGDDFDDIRAATKDLTTLLKQQAFLKDIEVDDNPGQRELNLELDLDAINRVNMNPATVSSIVRLLVDGSKAATTRYRGDELEVRVISEQENSNNINDILNFRVTTPVGTQVPLNSLVRSTPDTGMARIRHYKLRRAITVKADIEKSLINEKDANQRIKDAWKAQYAAVHNNVKLDYSGLLDDLNETISSLVFYFLIGVGLIYLILGTQFRSYFQPLLIIFTSLPLAFAGVAIGLLITQNPLSLMGMYGVVALGGIAVNSAIVLISAANDRIAAGMSVNHAIIYASRRRVVPILITALTTIAGLFSLATGLGGQSLLWGPVATAIVWGLSISTVLTLFIIPLLYRFFMQRSVNKHQKREIAHTMENSA